MLPPTEGRNSVKSYQKKETGVAHIKKRAWEVLEVCKAGDRLSQAVDQMIIVLISLNILSLSLETVPEYYQRWKPFFDAFETFSVSTFSIEFLLRFWSCVTEKKYQKPLTGRIRYSFTPLALFDLFAILPFYIPLFGIDLRFIRALRFFRLFRIAKLARYSESLRLFRRIAHKKRAELLTVVFLEGILMLFASCLLYYAENNAQPEAFSSIPAATWWAVATLSTVGYGDIYPITIVGRIIATFVIFLGIGLFTIPTGILAAGIIEEINLTKKGVKKCPNCKHLLN